MSAKPMAVAMLLLVTGCTSMNPVKSPSVDLGTQIRSGHVVARGDNVEIVTTDGRQHRFRVTAIDEDHSQRIRIAIPIDTIAQLKVRRFERGQNRSADRWDYDIGDRDRAAGVLGSGHYVRGLRTTRCDSTVDAGQVRLNDRRSADRCARRHRTSRRCPRSRPFPVRSSTVRNARRRARPCRVR